MENLKLDWEQLNNPSQEVIIKRGEFFIECDETFKVPKVIARIKLFGGGLTFTITDNMQFELPTEEQRENLRKTFGIEVELVEED